MRLRWHRVRVSPDLLTQARQETDFKTDAAMVAFALEEILRVKRQQRAVLSLFELALAHEREDRGARDEPQVLT